MASTVQKYTFIFKQYPLWKQALIASACFTTSTMALTFGSYYYNQLKYPPLPRIDYTITGDINNNQGICVFIHGWPDFGVYLWNKQIQYLSNKKYCCINMELPNFNPDRMQNPWGYDLITVVTALGNTIQKILSDNHKSDAGVTLIAHDWGSFLAELVCLNFKFNKVKMVLLDVGDGASKDPKERKKYRYQFFLAILFLLPRFIGTWLCRRAFIDNPKIPFTFPIKKFEEKSHRKVFHSTMGYLYFYIVIKVLLNQKTALQQLAITPRLNELDKVPILFIDANKPLPGSTDGPTRFYTDEFKEFLDKRDHCQFVQLECGHWIMDEEPDKLNTQIHNFL